MDKANNKANVPTRRNFLKTAAAASVGAMFLDSKVFAAGTEKLKIGLVGCGGRGLHDMSYCLQADENLELVAMADTFKDKVDNCYKRLKKMFGTFRRIRK